MFFNFIPYLEICISSQFILFYFILIYFIAKEKIKRNNNKATKTIAKKEKKNL